MTSSQPSIHCSIHLEQCFLTEIFLEEKPFTVLFLYSFLPPLVFSLTSFLISLGVIFRALSSPNQGVVSLVMSMRAMLALHYLPIFVLTALDRTTLVRFPGRTQSLFTLSRVHGSTKQRRWLPFTLQDMILHSIYATNLRDVHSTLSQASLL